MRSYRVAIVILNYLNYEDTIECIHSALSMKFSGCCIVVVDNGSSNKSYEKLCGLFRSRKNIYMLQNESNKGFARGNNTGIVFARENLGCEYVLCVNNDTIFSDVKMIDILIDSAKGKYAVLGPNIIGRDGLNQNPARTDITYKKIVRDLFFAVMFSVVDIDFLKKRSIVKSVLKRKDMAGKKSGKGLEKRIILHGAALLFTPLYFDHFPGFYPGTFLYYEENILAVLLRNCGLSAKHVKTTEIRHKEDMSSILGFGNNNRYKSRRQLIGIMKCLYLKIIGKKSFGI